MRPPSAWLIPGLLCSLLGTAGAAPRVSAQSIIVNPVPTSLSVRVWTDRTPGGTGTAIYAPGDRIRLFTSVNQDAYVYLFNVDPRGNVDLILPNRYGGGGNFLKANTTKVFPDAGDPFSFDIATPYGLNRVLALASRTPLNLGQIASWGAKQNTFATVNVQGQERLAQALSIVVTPVDQSGWVSGTASYSVVPRAVGGRPAPLRPAPVPPVRPAPTRPAPAHPEDFLDRDWQTSFERQGRVEDVYAEYAARLRQQGYRQVERRENGNGLRLRGEFRRGQDRVTLEVRQQGGRFEVKVTHR
ncbi:DUF4384 domain-containing protein [Deinococcus planocerae]|uniref:DUF4384 domain-containing protein n=1 Tax=Deinococcus planocerae TaxID=1737569 RepID=UPI000C7F5FD8|nr:DUF4384 domain-containing protein [Deinococcus planocerae]